VELEFWLHPELLQDIPLVGVGQSVSVPVANSVPAPLGQVPYGWARQSTATGCGTKAETSLTTAIP